MKKEETSNKFSKYSSWLKENLNIVVLVPTVIGGVWQILELLTISPSYIRFFSITQVVSDGLLSLFILTMIYLAIKLGSMRFITSKLENPEKLNAKQIIGKIAYLIFVSGIALYLICFQLIPLTKLIPENNSFFVLLLTIIIAIITLGFLIHSIITFINTLRLIPLLDKYISKIVESFSNDTKSESDNSDISVELNESPKKMILGLIILLLSFKFLIIPIFGLIGQFRTEFILPSNFKNLEFIECKISSVYKKSTDFKIKYLNDTYIFVSVLQDDNEEILVLKFDDLMKNNCK